MAFNAKKRVAYMLKKMKQEAKSVISFSQQLEKNAKKMSKDQTWPEREFEKMMKELKVEYMKQKIIGSKIFDFYIPSINTLVEVDGDYFHCNPDTFDKASNMQKRNVKNDKFKDVLAEGLGYKLERVWESDLKKEYSKVKSRFKDLIG